MSRRLRTIYLDNSHLHLLSEVRRNNGPRFTKFMKVWNSQKCALALSLTHLHEISRYNDDVKKAARYDLLEELLPIHCDISITNEVPSTFRLLTHREIFNALIKLNVVSVQNEALLQYAEGLPEQLTSKDHIALLRQLETVDLYRNMLEAFYEANRVSAAANSRPPRTKYERQKLSQITDTKIKADDVADLLRQLEKDNVDIERLGSLHKLVTPELLDEMFGSMRIMIEQFVERADEVGSSNALAEFLGVDSTDRASTRMPLDLLIQQHTFEFSVRQFLTDVCHVQDKSLLDNLLKQVKLEDCPGTWLKHTVQIQMRKAVTEDEPSNYYDLEHLAYLPYVDLLLADKRITTFAHQVLNSTNLPLSLNGVREPISVPNSVDAVESVISSLTCLEGSE